MVQGVLEPVGSGDEPGSPEVSVVIPCLNEAETLGAASTRPRVRCASTESLARSSSRTTAAPMIHGRSPARLGARVVDVESEGLRQRANGRHCSSPGQVHHHGGRGRESYDFAEIPKFVEKLRQGYDLVQGCRLPSGGGTVLPGAMPWLHRWWGNPDVLAAGTADVPGHGPRRLLRHARLYQSVLQPARAALHRDGVRDRDDHQGQPCSAASIAEVPITYIRTGARRTYPISKRSATAGGRCDFFLIYSPRWLFLVPGRSAHSGGP